MNRSEFVAVYDSQSAAYRRAFQVFLDHTDEKAKTRRWLDRLVQTLPARRVFIDAGAGTGALTGWLSARFDRTIAIEPNGHLREKLRSSCPDAEVLPEMILQAEPPAQADLVLCSHVFYYVDPSTWLAHLEKLASWLAPSGVLVVMLQNHATGYMRMLDHFFGKTFSLSELARRFGSARADDYLVAIETEPVQVVTRDFGSAYTVAEFMLNQVPIAAPPTRQSLEQYVRQQFADPSGSFLCACDQDFLLVRRRSS